MLLANDHAGPAEVRGRDVDGHVREAILVARLTQRATEVRSGLLAPLTRRLAETEPARRKAYA
jgi:hypothetical protein